jgi:16S rRNA U1498 N3-methylase RsmE
MNVILVETSELDGMGAATIVGRRAAHIASVLKAAPGDTIRVGCAGRTIRPCHDRRHR